MVRTEARPRALYIPQQSIFPHKSGVDCKENITGSILCFLFVKPHASHGISLLYILSTPRALLVGCFSRFYLRKNVDNFIIAAKQKGRQGTVAKRVYNSDIGTKKSSPL